MRHRIRNGKPQFLLKWSGFPHDQNTWEPREHLLDDRLLKDYLKRNPGAKRARVLVSLTCPLLPVPWRPLSSLS